MVLKWKGGDGKDYGGDGNNCGDGDGEDDGDTDESNVTMILILTSHRTRLHDRLKKTKQEHFLLTSKVFHLMALKCNSVQNFIVLLVYKKVPQIILNQMILNQHHKR